jgi:hypothetical protein
MKKIPLTQGKFALVDDEDYKLLIQWKWYASKYRNRFCAQRDSFKNKEKTVIKMHRQILGLIKGDGKIVDHINQNQLDNRRVNLRIASYSLNNYNTARIHKNNKSGYRGVCYSERDKSWRAYIRVNGKQKTCGYHKCPILAALAHDKEIIKYRGKDSILNFPE